jgi:putative transposase
MQRVSFDVTHCGVDNSSDSLKTQSPKAIQPKSFQPKTTDSKHRLGYSPNLLLDATQPDGMNQFSRRIIESNLGTDMTESLVLKVLGRAIRERHLTDGLIHHTDRGGQYAGTKYRAILRRANIHQSMNRAADCYDNAFMESCFGTLKRELEMTEYNSHREAHAEIAQYIRYYNFERKHSGIEYLKPVQFEALINQPESEDKLSEKTSPPQNSICTTAVYLETRT